MRISESKGNKKEEQRANIRTNCQQNPCPTTGLYNAPMEALIEDEKPWYKEGCSTGCKSTREENDIESEFLIRSNHHKESSKDKDLKVGSKTSKSAPAKDPIAGWDTISSYAKIPDTTTCFRQFLMQERLLLPEPGNGIIPPNNDLPDIRTINWANDFQSHIKFQMKKAS
ncbi:hypothetical protein Tco_0658079 [Tanacetum coccineum]